MKDLFDFAGDVDWLGTQYRTILRQDETNGAMSITDSHSPAGSGPPRHVHHDADETFVMLSGQAIFWKEGETFRAGPGNTVFVPRGVPHTFRVTDDGPSRHLVIMTPGGFEGFFYAMAEGGYAIPQDMERITGIASEYQLEFVGPPLDGTE